MPKPVFEGKIVTIIVTKYIQVQGDLVARLPDGRTVVSDGSKMVTGQEVNCARYYQTALPGSACPAVQCNSIPTRKS